MSPRDAIVQACLLRFRPIMMTTLAALFGALPLALESGTGSELRIPLGVTIIGGLLLSQLLTLYTTPVIYLAMERLKQRFARADPRATRRRDVRAGRAAARRSERDELLRTLHPPAGRHDAAGDRAVAGRRSSPTASCRSPAADASISRPSASSASRPGADPATMAATVAAPLERRLGDIAGVTEITSTCSLGTHPIIVQFDLTRNIDGAARDVQAAINAALTDLPGDLPTLPSFRKFNPAAAPVLILALTSKTMLAERDLRRRRHRRGAAHRAGRRRRRGHRQRRRAAGDARAGQPGRDRLDGREPGGRAHSPSPTPMRKARSARSTGRDLAHTIGTNDQLRTPARLRRRRGEDRERHHRAASATSPTSSRACATAARPPGSIASRRCC